MFQVFVLIDLKKTDNDPHQEEKQRCQSVELEKIVDFFDTDNKQRYKFSTLSEAHHATQALLNNMLKDTGIYNGTNSFSTHSTNPQQQPQHSTHSSASQNF